MDSFPYFEKFESGFGGWGSSDPNVFQLDTPKGAILNRAYSGGIAWATGSDRNYFPNQFGWIESPEFDFSSLGANPWIRFKFHGKSENCCDHIKVEYSLNAGETYQLLGSFQEGQNWYNPELGLNYWSGDSDGWSIASIEADVLKDKTSARLRIVFFSDFSEEDEGFLIDDIEITSGFEDVETRGILHRTSACSFSNQESIEVELKNLSVGPKAGVTLFYSINGGSPVQGQSLNLDSGELRTYTFPTTADFSQDGDYLLKVWSSTSGDTTRVNDTSSLLIRNLPELSAFPYTEDFQGGSGDWEVDGINSSWELGIPMKKTIVGHGDSSIAWVTGGLDFGSYSNDELSMVLSPCFDMRAVSDPLFEFDAWWNTESPFDGIALQRSLNNESSWTNIGSVGTGLNWFNNSQVGALSSFDSLNKEGWSGRNSTSDGSMQWLRAQNKQQFQASDSSVRFRFLFASDVSAVDDGFAFDNFWIYPRVQQDLAILEVYSESGSNFCIGDTTRLAVILRNNGSLSLDTPSFGLLLDGSAVTLATTPSMNSEEIDTIWSDEIILSNAGEFDVIAFGTQAGDPYAFNDSASSSIRVLATKPDFPGLVADTVCDSGLAVLSVGLGPNELLSWYSEDGTLLGAGEPFQTGAIQSDTSFSFEIYDGVKDTLGPNRPFPGGGGHTSVTGYISMEVERPIIIQHVWIDATGSGSFDVYLIDSEGNTVYSALVEHGMGFRRVYLGIPIREEGSYTIEVRNIFGGLMFRNTGGAKYSSYLIPNVVRLTGNPVDLGFYYYLYNMEVDIMESCTGMGLASVSVGEDSTVADFSFLQTKNRVEFRNLSTSASSFFWDFGDGSFSLEREPYHEFDTGSYDVWLKADGKCGEDSIMMTIDVSEITSLEELEKGDETLVKVYPNPSPGILKISWSKNKIEKSSLEVFDLNGERKKAFDQLEPDSVFDLQNLDPGMYILKIQMGEEIQFQRWIKL